MDELKPCPFCGGEAKLNCEDGKMDYALLPDGKGGFLRIKALAYSWNVRCAQCGASGFSYEDRILREKSGDVCVIEDGRKTAIKAWNRRATNEPDN